MRERHLLSDEAIRSFIVDGYVQVRADFPNGFHQSVYEQIEMLMKGLGNPGNNLLPILPDIQKVYSHPAVTGALSSLLGPNYIMHPHRYCHLNSPGSKDQNWHKDDYVFDKNIRHHRYRWVMAFYYPQDVSEDMGPTGLLPGKQFNNQISDDHASLATESACSLSGEAGTVSIVNFDVWHRATPNLSEKKRYMLKFNFLRVEEPDMPSWDHSEPAWQPVENDRHDGLSNSVWHWLRGSNNGATGTVGKSEVRQLVEKLIDRDEHEDARLDYAYELACCNEAVLPLLVAALKEEAIQTADKNVEKSPSNVGGGNPSDLYTAHALSAIGEPAVPLLMDLLKKDEWPIRAAASGILGNIGPAARNAAPALAENLGHANWWVRRNAAEALGTIGSIGGKGIPELNHLLEDDTEPVARNAAIAIGKIGQPTDGAVDALRNLLSHENRYTRFHASVALKRLGTPEAMEVLVDDLFAARWCPITTNKAPY